MYDIGENNFMNYLAMDIPMVYKKEKFFYTYMAAYPCKILVKI